MTPEEFQFFTNLLEKHAGIVLEPGKEYLVEARLAPVARDHGFHSVSTLLQHLRANVPGRAHWLAIEALTTNETSFFRDEHPFTALREVILPNLLARRASARSLNIWCAAASTGQEPYSLAMLIRDSFPQLLNWNVSFIATDLSEATLARAREGRFNATEIGRGLPAQFRQRYFITDGDSLRVRDEVRRMVAFRLMNLVGPWPNMPELDLVLLRNVLIYFNVETKRNILQKVHRYLRPDGCLLLGAAESTLHIDDSFEVVHLDKTAYYRPRRASANPASLGLNWAV
jgi:chemotaxis protein methyltransferase CheR